MNSFDEQDIRFSDMKVMIALLEERTVTRAAERLGVTQSALSYTLDRMRKRFSDPLFVRIGNHMAPTSFAERLAAAATRVVQMVDMELAHLNAFVPETTEREFRIGVNETGAMTMVPKIIQHLATAAPRARLAPIPGHASSIGSALENGDIDIAAGHFPNVDDRLFQKLLFRRNFVCIAAKNNSDVKDCIHLEDFSKLPKFVSSPMTVNWLNARMAEHGLQSVPAISAQFVAAIPFAVAASRNLVAIIPEEFYDIFAPIAAIRCVEFPLPIPLVDIHMYWHVKFASDPANCFIRDLVYDAVRDR